ncbi:Uncharacterized conserved protein, DUF1697 family [Sinosporangium album]|uniref:Uncharacterized conserved protein, DUF1697 family n=1 Tax=Sinosporangium album TaxID=504805 RepID=A0A1G7XEJ2_9ACTN|nr:DUF1697 domain-containing protein [Sinosporangium album]SDG82668.1 Uncharacterized conserved protein, DUF1697 family [Sinosporangium album]
MTAYAALLRGVNVGGHAKVPMAELRQVVEGLGYEGVRTYVASGNVVFRGPAEAPGVEGSLSGEIEQGIERRFGFPVSCLVRSGAHLQAVAQANPFAEHAAEGTVVHATFLSERVLPDRLASIRAEAFLPERFALGDRVIYLHLPGGMGRSKLAETLARPALFKGVVATSRNWNTVTKLVEWTSS